MTPLKLARALSIRVCSCQLRQHAPGHRSDVQVDGVSESGDTPSFGKSRSSCIDVTPRRVAPHLSLRQIRHWKYSRNRPLHRRLYDCCRYWSARVRHARKKSSAWRPEAEAPSHTEQEYLQGSEEEPDTIRRIRECYFDQRLLLPRDDDISYSTDVGPRRSGPLHF